ncbi:hypothetical protein GCM10017750_10850 [Streptomyces racemochromogenes]
MDGGVEGAHAGGTVAVVRHPDRTSVEDPHGHRHGRGQPDQRPEDPPPAEEARYSYMRSLLTHRRILIHLYLAPVSTCRRIGP